MLADRRLFASLCWLIAAAFLTFATWVAVAVVQEYGLSPNNDLPLDLANGFLTYVLPVGLVTGTISWIGWRLWHPR
jgi:hypothetical protein